MGIELIIILFLIVLNGIFAMAELALSTAKTAKLKHDAKNGSKRAKAALKLINEPNRFLSTIQIGITLIGILTGVFGGDRLSKDIKKLLENYHYLKDYSESLSLIIVVGIITYFSLIIGEIVPKRIALAYSEKLAKLLARPMNVLSVIAKPAIWLLSISTEIVLKILRVKTPEENVTEAELKEMIAQATKSGNIEKVEKDIVERTFKLSDKRISEIMIDQKNIIYLDIRHPLIKNKDKILNNVHRNYPVYDGDKILGTIHIKEILTALLKNESTEKLTKVLKPVIYVSPDDGSYYVFNIIKEKKASMIFIRDNQEKILGIVTLDDLVDELIGEIHQLDNYIAPVVKRHENSWFVEASMPLEQFLKYFNLSDEIIIDSHAKSLEDFMLEYIEEPETGEKFTQFGYIFEIADMDGNKIDKVLLEKVSE